jgi:tRNA threonylcarbamoyladenosine biosynthesis protein TsaE
MADKKTGTRARAFSSPSPEATEELAALIGARLSRGALVALEGELGSGKTAFVRGLARGLGVTEPVTSPTYALMHAYPGRIGLWHFDAWMEGRERSFLLDGGLDSIEHGDVAAIEWADRVLDLLPLPRLRIALAHDGKSSRLIRVWAEGGDVDGGELDRLVATLDVPAGVTELE